MDKRGWFARFLYQARMIGIPGTHPIVLRDPGGRTHVMQSAAARLLNIETMPDEDWRTLGADDNGDPAWHRLRGVARFWTAPHSRFEMLVSRHIAFAATLGPDALKMGPVSLPPLPPALPEQVDLLVELHPSFRVVGSRTLPETAGSRWLQGSGRPGRVRRHYTQGSEELCALARIVALYVATGTLRVSPEAVQFVTRNDPGAARTLAEDLAKIGDAEVHSVENKRYVLHEVRSEPLAALLVLLCGYGPRKAGARKYRTSEATHVPSFVLDAAPNVQAAFLSAYAGMSYESAETGSLLPVEAPFAHAAAITYMLSQPAAGDEALRTYLSSTHQGSLRLAHAPQDPFPRTRAEAWHQWRASEAYTVQTEDCDHFVHATTRVPILKSAPEAWAPEEPPSEGGGLERAGGTPEPAAPFARGPA